MKRTNSMKKIMKGVNSFLSFCLVTFFLLSSQPAEAQFFKKLFKKNKDLADLN